MQTFWECSCGRQFKILLDLAAHNEETGHTIADNQIKRVPPMSKKVVTEPPKRKVVVKRSAEIKGFIVTKYYVE